MTKILHIHQKTKLVTSLFFLVFSILLFTSVKAQNYQWQWAKKGGGNQNSGTFDYDSEQIYDMKIGSDNNYYFIGSIQGNTAVNLNNVPVTTYNSSLGGNDVFIFSTTCDGTIRWSQSIGGGDIFDSSYNLVLDNQNNVYVGVFVGHAEHQINVHFSPTETLPGVPANANVYSDYYKNTFLVKYDSNGNFIKKAALEGDKNGYSHSSQILDLVIDSNNNLHFIAGFGSGNHLNGNLTVPSSATNLSPNYYLIKYDNNLNYISNIQLPLSAGSGFAGMNNIRFAFDESLNRFYIIGSRSVNVTSQPIPLVYENKAIVNRSYLLAVNGTNGSEVFRREIYTDPTVSTMLPANIFNSIAIDANSDIYVTGNVFLGAANSSIKIYDPNNPGTTSSVFYPTVAANTPFIAKIDKFGQTQWLKTPGLVSSNNSYSIILSVRGITLNGDEVAVGGSASYFTWDSFVYNNIQNYQPDPVLLRFNKQTGTAIGLHAIKGSFGNTEHMTAVTKDNDGNYVVGGSFVSTLFGAPSNVPSLVGNATYDFYIAKLAATTCGVKVMATNELSGFDVGIYPNPATDFIYIKTKDVVDDYEIYNSVGQLVRQGKLGKENEINLHNLPSSVYMIKVYNVKGESSALKVIKK
ncbi:T9SS type A sorting domain-containing protein [Chryseobacterium camelliae]|uniref:T9SS type A sorting domain-containing protein n=1 Tax=Chryseobacterium camelliae TaxID=1265445 RepID=A0ABY7QNC9_9FLAO|nr:T9SS type A sorting domain-containing protein [Chryseobacterium camelliae]WBV60674.1 T9SS type A sorting domain-containing protein [Chryseobacterium camelliae]